MNIVAAYENVKLISVIKVTVGWDWLYWEHVREASSDANQPAVVLHRLVYNGRP